MVTRIVGRVGDSLQMGDGDSFRMVMVIKMVRRIKDS